MKKQRIIGVDLDDVLLNFTDAVNEFCNSNYDTSYRREEALFFNLEKVWGCSKEEVAKRLKAFYASPAHEAIAPVAGAQEAVAQLSRENTLIIITARPEQHREMTSRWLEKYYPKVFSGVHFTNQATATGIVNLIKRTKAEVCKELGVDIFIDDSLDNAINLAEAGVPVLLLDTPWNQSEPLPGITRVYSWGDALKEFSRQ